LDIAADQIVPGLTGEPAWPTLRAHLLLLAAPGNDPASQLAATASSRELNFADDRAAVLDWRLDDTGHRNAGSGPLPWLPGIPTRLRDHPEWGGYLTARSELVAALADQIRASAADTHTPEWTTKSGSAVPTRILADVRVWRAAMQVSPEDRRPTGPVQLQKAARIWQRHLDRQVIGDQAPALQEWGWLLDQINPNLTKDEFAPVLADRLAAITRAGLDASQLLRSAASSGGPLPNDHAAAALWWRIIRHLTAAPRSRPTTPSPRSGPRGWMNCSGPTGSVTSSPAGGGNRWLQRSSTVWSAVGDSTASSEPPPAHKTGLLTCAPLGTSLTDEQARQLARIGRNPIVATDADIAGRVAAERDFWILTLYRLDPRYAQLPEGSDPADLLARHGPAALVATLDRALPLGERLLNERLTTLPPDQAQREATRVVAARPPASWDEGSSTISSRLNAPLHAVRQTLLAQVKDWNTDSRRAAGTPLRGVNDVKRRRSGAAQVSPEQRWAALADQLDQRLLRQGDWPALAQLIQHVHEQGHDVAAITRGLLTATPLNDLPAQDLRYRLVAHLALSVDLPRPPVDTPTAKTTTHPGPHRKALASTVAPTRTPPR
jgi:hypothetical protein